MLKEQFSESLLFVGELLDLNSDHVCDLEGELNHDMHSPSQIIIKADITDSEVGGFDQRLDSKKCYIIKGRTHSNRSKYYFNVSIGKRSFGEIEFRVSSYYAFRDEIINYKMMHLRFETETLKKPTVFFSWSIPEFNQQGWKFNPIEHPHKGLIFGADPSDYRKVEESGWPENIHSIKNSTGEYKLRHSLNFKQELHGPYRTLHVLPEIVCQCDIECEEFPDEWNEIQKEFNRFRNLFLPINYGIKFVNGYRVDSYMQIMSYFNPNSKRYVWVKRVNKVRSQKSGRQIHNDLYNGYWKFIEDFTNRFIQLDVNDQTRVKRCIDRFTEAIEADYLELKLTLLHSALSILLNIDRYNNFKEGDKPTDFPMPPGGVTYRMAKFILEHNLEWRDLIPEDRPESILYKFNNLRNKYLKQKTHQIEDYTPIRILHRMFERILITEIGLEFNEYKDSFGNY